MAHLLGSKTCIDSLRVDINDLEKIIHDIIKRTGSIKCHSWKFPDKLAIDVDIKELLERYQYGINDVDNQVSHIVLFEIIIDRLLFVIHGSWRFFHELQINFFSNTIDSSSTVNHQTGLSIGLVVRRYWEKLLHIYILLQQNDSTRKRSIRPMTVNGLKSNHRHEKQCQTIETAFSPCASCFKLQQCLRNFDDLIIKLCHQYNLPSSLAHYRCSTTILPDWLSADDIFNCFDCQTKDFDRLSKHLEYLNMTLDNTKYNLSTSETNCKKQFEINEKLQKEIQNEKQMKLKQKDFYEKTFKDLNQQIDSLTIEKTNLDKQLKSLTDECRLKNEHIDKLESLNTKLNVSNEQRLKSNELMKTLEEDCIRLQTEVIVYKRDLEERNRDLQKERIRIENMIRQEENHQTKHKNLTKSYEDTLHECQMLKKQIIDLENERDELQKSFRMIHKTSDSSKDIQSIMEVNTNLLQEVTSLKFTVEQLRQQIKHMHERDSHESVLATNFMVNNINRNRQIRNESERNRTPIVTEERYKELKYETGLSSVTRDRPFSFKKTGSD